jgi:hypothetical protein
MRPLGPILLAFVLFGCGSPTTSGSGGAGGGGGSAGSSGAGGGGGSATGGGTGSGGGAYPLKSLDESCYGITGMQILSAAQPSYATTLTYNTAEPNGGTTTSLTIRVQYDQGTVVCNPPSSIGPTGPSEGPHVTVDVSVDFDTEDGAFQETFSAQLDGFNAESVRVSASESQDAIKGSYDPNMPDLTNVTVGLDGAFAGTTTSGSVIKHGQKSAQVGEGAVVATW